MVSMMPVWCQKSSLMKLKCNYDKDPVNPHTMVNRVATLDRSYLKSNRIDTATASSTRDTL